MADAKFCTRCGTPVEPGHAFCGNCGVSTAAAAAAPPPETPVSVPFSSHSVLYQPKPKSRATRIVGFLALVFVVVLVAVFVVSRNDTGSTSDSQSASMSSDSNAIMIPADESSFISTVASAQAQSHQVENDMQRGGVKARRDSMLCGQLGSFAVSNWVGTVTSVDSNSDGKGVFAVRIAPDISLKTWNNSFSDIEDNTLMPPGSPVFNAASIMKTGQTILFSGTFLRGEEGDCVKEGSLTLQGKVESPDFIFRFSSVAPYSRPSAAHVENNTPPEQPSIAAEPPATYDSSGPNQQSSANSSSGNPQFDASSVSSQPPAQQNVTQEASVPAENMASPVTVAKMPANMAVGMLLSKVDPVYPPIAKAARVSGTVVLKATISKTGEIENLGVISGPAMLQQSAVEAVQQWRYRPYMVNGEPVEVVTTVNVTFSLGD